MLLPTNAVLSTGLFLTSLVLPAAASAAFDGHPAGGPGLGARHDQPRLARRALTAKQKSEAAAASA